MNAPGTSSLHPSPVTVLIARRARAHNVAAFEEANEKMMAAACIFDGHLGGYLVRPTGDPGSDPYLYNVVFAFDTESHLSAWQQSPERARWLAAMAPHTESESGYQRVPGFEHWFDSGGTRVAPARWKVAIVSWIGICPTVWLAQTLLGPILGHWPSFLRVMVATGLVTVLMTWWIAPLLTRLFASWMYSVPTPRHKMRTL